MTRSACGVGLSDRHAIFLKSVSRPSRANIPANISSGFLSKAATPKSLSYKCSRALPVAVSVPVQMKRFSFAVPGLEDPSPAALVNMAMCVSM